MKKLKTTGFRSLYAFGTKSELDLSLSENPLGCSPEVNENLEVAMDRINHYPDPNSIKLKILISKKLGIDSENIIVSTGSESLIKLIPQLLLEETDTVLVPQVTFPMFRIASELVGARVKSVGMGSKMEISLDKIKNLVDDTVKLIFICNPNNPTGDIIPRENILNFVASTTAFVVVDEANIEFGGESVAGDIKKFPNLIVLRTFSKGFGLASLRIGFGIASLELIYSLCAINQPFPVTEISQKIAESAFQDFAFIEKSKVFMDKQRLFLQEKLLELGFVVFPSQANNLLVKLPVGLDGDKFQSLLLQNGVSIVNGNNFESLDSTFFRVSPRLAETNMAFIEIIRKILNELQGR